MKLHIHNPAVKFRFFSVISTVFIFLLFSPFAQDTNTGKTKKPAYDLAGREYTVPTSSKAAFLKWRLAASKEDKAMLDWRWETARIGIKWRSIMESRVLDAFLQTPREHFCRERNLARAYEHNWLSIGHGVTISGPHIVMKMTSVINPHHDHKVLEIGTGSGYQSAMLAQLSNWVYTIEIIEPLARETDLIYKKLQPGYPEYNNIRRKIGDGYYGWEEEAPFDRIIVTCGIDHIPPPLLKQLKTGGIMVIPVGAPGSQTLLKVVKKQDAEGNISFERSDVYEGRLKVSFVAFTADKGTGRHNVKQDKPQLLIQD